MSQINKRLEALEQKNTVALTGLSHLAILRLMCFEHQEEHGHPMAPAQQQEALNRMRERDRAMELDRQEGETPPQRALRRFAEANSEGQRTRSNQYAEGGKV